MKYGYSEQKPDLLVRLNRVEGQVRGISKMVEEDKYCIDILTQVSAVKAAIDKVALELLRDHARHCMGGETKRGNRTKADELVSAISRIM